jgi:hypothetical protein
MRGLALLLGPEVPPEHYADACRIGIRLYRTMSRLDKHDAASLGRLMWKALQQPPA